MVLLRGINVGGKNKVSMEELRTYLTGIGFSDVTTYINSGNIFVSSDKKPVEIKKLIEELLPKKFKLDSELIHALVLSRTQLEDIVNNKPEGFGAKPDTYHSDAIFLMDISIDDAMKVFDPREGVDKIWPGPGVVYSQRLSAQRTKSRLNKIIGTPVYKSMTIRSWNTATKLLALMQTV